MSNRVQSIIDANEYSPKATIRLLSECANDLEQQLSASQAREAELREKLEKVQSQAASWKLLVEKNQQLAIDAIKRAETAERERDNWIDSAKHFSGGMEYYSGLIDECAKHIGLSMYVADDSGVSPEPLRAKIAECVGELVQRAEAAEARIKELEAQPTK